MASVRSAEHVKSWVAGEGPPWSTFVNNYLADATLKLRLRIMVGNYLHSAATNPPSHYPPDYEAEAMLRHVQDEAEEERGAYNIVAISKHLDQLRKVQKDTALARPLRDLALILKDSASVQAHFDSDRKRIITLAQRLRRSRNAAVHGGVLSSTHVTRWQTFRLIWRFKHSMLRCGPSLRAWTRRLFSRPTGQTTPHFWTSLSIPST